MRVLVTGVAGFIGSHLADRLLAGGHEVYGIDNFLTGRDENVAREVDLWNDSIVTEDGWDGLFNIFSAAKPDVVVHAAASYNDPTNIERDMLTNAHGTAHVVSECKKHSARLIYFQTSLCYGLNPPPYPLAPSQPLDPHGSYAVSKTAGEQVIRDSGLDYVSFRLANIYGPRNLTGPTPTFYKRLKAGETCTVADTRRDFVYIDDAIDLFARAVYGEGRPGAYHVSTGGDYSIETMFQHVAGALGLSGGPIARIPRRMVRRGPDDAKSLLLDPTKTLEEFGGWAARTPLEEGVRRAVEWYDKHGVGNTYTHLEVG